MPLARTVSQQPGNFSIRKIPRSQALTAHSLQSEAGHPSFAKEVPYEEPGPLRHPAGQSLLMDMATGPTEQR